MTRLSLSSVVIGGRKLGRKELVDGISSPVVRGDGTTVLIENRVPISFRAGSRPCCSLSFLNISIYVLSDTGETASLPFRSFTVKIPMVRSSFNVVTLILEILKMSFPINFFR